LEDCTIVQGRDAMAARLGAQMTKQWVVGRDMIDLFTPPLPVNQKQKCPTTQNRRCETGIWQNRPETKQNGRFARAAAPSFSQKTWTRRVTTP
jgi:hypothetical protein